MVTFLHYNLLVHAHHRHMYLVLQICAIWGFGSSLRNNISYIQDTRKFGGSKERIVIPSIRYNPYKESGYVMHKVRLANTYNLIWFIGYGSILSLVLAIITFILFVQ